MQPRKLVETSKPSSGKKTERKKVGDGRSERERERERERVSDGRSNHTVGAERWLQFNSPATKKPDRSSVRCVQSHRTEDKR